MNGEIKERNKVKKCNKMLGSKGQKKQSEKERN